MSTTVSYPSALVPGPPPVRLQMPAGWSQVWVPDTLIAIRDDADAGHFLANVVVRRETDGPTIDRIFESIRIDH